MDLDLQTYSVGGDSTINRISQFSNDLKTTGQTHNRIIILEVFGRYAGHTAFRGGVGADADCILIPEIGVDFEVVYDHFKEIFTRRLNNDILNSATYTIVVAEGIRDMSGDFFTDKSSGLDSFGHQRLSGAGAFVRSILTDFSKKDANY
jgi:6-phosphofructokinase 1